MKTIEELGISPWPWESHKQFVIVYYDGSVVAVTNVRYVRLISAAPKLYEALAALLHCAEREAPYTYGSHMSTAMDMARKALAKAGCEEARHG